ncbi:putative DDE superfamily endonuclease [Monocercomonoides exilis]|uniref:putative DDE superfamily endonuclease n=1 Tax=Monocercomonoides exilis TaxID=2049356 RepID=UPI003559420F|nr:putative DDE superfamily endonuclease [Monocercomonoides exilis]|eukprot:MONOS_5066.1-p1 / transcript=MONOS_5066.1 / gene=MONOS_5066 / organism=Monocercomonoides_exilis_PA203 / gene_product=unspecified product / transcript_product=unspecified product / location=Mono_scaffold00143:96071-97546(+) / protein_length=453 / sequence_SO=supercontig / SO=protein_coding / is_pseudo=false
MKKEVARKSPVGQLKLREAMLSFKYRQFRNPLERMAHVVNDGAVRMVDAYNSKKFCKIRIKRAVKAARQGRLVPKIGRPAVVIGVKEQIIENIVNDQKPENTPDVKVSAPVAYDYIKRHLELNASKQKIVVVNRLAVSCQQVLKPWHDILNGLHQNNSYNNALIFNVDESSLRVPDSSNRNVVHPAKAKPGFAKSAARMANSTLIAAVAADGQSLPSVILWPSLKLPDDLKPLQSTNLEIWPNKCGWMESSTFRKYALTILLPSIKERRQRMSLDESHCLLQSDSHISRADPTIWREFKKENVDVVTFVPHSTHICQPLDLGVFDVLKSELSSQYEAPSSSSSAAKRTALVEALQQSIHSALSPSVIKRAFKSSGVLKDSSGPVLMKLPLSSTYPLSSHKNRFDFYGKEITEEKVLNEWDDYLRKKSEMENEKENISDEENDETMNFTKKLKR